MNPRLKFLCVAAQVLMWCAVGALLLAGCQSAQADVAGLKGQGIQSPIRVTCEYSSAPSPRVRYRISNISKRRVHIFERGRMPYLLFENGALQILRGVNPPDKHKDYGGIYIPNTRPLRAGETVEEEVSLSPLVLHDHYGMVGPGLRNDLHGKFAGECRVAWGETPITVQIRRADHMGIYNLLDWQHFASASVQIVLP